MGQVEEAIAFARAQKGKPYDYGSIGPDKYDCSGLICASYAAAHPPIRLPHWTGALIFIGDSVKRSELEPGDMVFPNPGHVQLYVGNGQMIEAQQRGVPVREGPLWGFWAARRVVGSHGALGTASDFVDVLPGNIPNPFSAAATLTDVVRPIGVAALNITNPQFWKRIGMGVLGTSLLIAGIIYANRRPIEKTIGAVGGVAGSLAGTAAQGAAFGFGAGKSGGVSAGGLSAGPSSGGAAAATTRLTKGPPRPPNAAKRAQIQPRTVPMSPPQSPTMKVIRTAKAPPRPLPGDASVRRSRSARNTEIAKGKK